MSEEGETVRSAAKRFAVSVASTVRIGRRAGRRQVPGKIGGHRCAVLPDGAGDWLLARLAEKPDLTIRVVTTELAERGVQLAQDTAWRFVTRAGQSVKKRP